MEKYKEWTKKRYPSKEKAYGQCKKATKKMKKAFPELERVKGFYWCPVLGRVEHWWLKDQNGKIVDPTAIQFPTKGLIGEYQELNDEELPVGKCRECGELVFKNNYSSNFCTKEHAENYITYLNNV